MENNDKFIKLSNDQIFDIIGNVASLFHRVIPIENTIAVTDNEKFMFHFAGAESAATVSNLVGKPFPKSGNIPLTLQTGTQQIGLIPKEIYGVAFKSSTIPLKDYEGNIIGALSLALSLKNQDALQEAIENISSSAEQLNATTDEISSSAVHLSTNVSEVLDETQEIVQLIAQTDHILDFINHVASNSRLLGLNAAIEAARAGQFGRGFAVVADEIRKMAENSAKSVDDTKKLISSINNKVGHLLKKIQELSDVALTQAAATQEIAACLQNFESSTQTVQRISKII